MAGGWGTPRGVGVDGKNIVDARIETEPAGPMTEEQRAARYAAVEYFARDMAEPDPEEFELFPDR